MPGVTDSWAVVETEETTPAAAPETAGPDSAGRGAMAALAGTLSEVGSTTSARRHSRAVRRLCGLTAQRGASAGMAGPAAPGSDCGAGTDPAGVPEDREDSPKEVLVATGARPATRREAESTTEPARRSRTRPGW